MNKIKDLIKKLEEVEYAPAEEAAVVASVEAVIEEQDSATEELSSQLESAKADAEAAKQALEVEVTRNAEATAEAEVETDSTVQTLTSYLEKVSTELASTRDTLTDMAEWRTNVDEDRQRLATPSQEEMEARHEEMKALEEETNPQMTDEDLAEARGEPRGCDGLWSRYMSEFKDAYGHIWDEDYDGDPIRGQNVRLIQASDESRPRFIARD